MAETFKCALDGTKIKVRRLLWNEMKKFQEKAADPSTDMAEEILNTVILEPKNWGDKIDVLEVKKIVDYAWGIRESLTD